MQGSHRKKQQRVIRSYLDKKKPSYKHFNLGELLRAACDTKKKLKKKTKRKAGFVTSGLYTIFIPPFFPFNPLSNIFTQQKTIFFFFFFLVE